MTERPSERQFNNPPNVPGKLTRSLNLDSLGFSASLICALHCALVPLFITSLPLLGLEFLANPAVEGTMILTGLAIGITSLAHGYLHHHRNFAALVILVAGFAIIAAGHLTALEAYESLVTPLGAGIVAFSHFVNWRLCNHDQKHAHKADHCEPHSNAS